MILSYKSQLIGWECFQLGATSATALLLREQTWSEILKALRLKALFCFSECHNRTSALRDMPRDVLCDYEWRLGVNPILCGVHPFPTSRYRKAVHDSSGA
jgi:hypothetical protein